MPALHQREPPAGPIGVGSPYTPEFDDSPNYWSPEIDEFDVTSKEIHSLKHYLRHPAVAAAFLNQTISPDDFDPDPVSAAAVKIALVKYRKNTLKGNLQALVADIKQLKPGQFGDWKKAVDKVRTIMQLIKEF